MAKILELFSVPYPEQNGIHEKAIIDPTAKIGKNVSIGPCAYNTIIYANVMYLQRCKMVLTVLFGQV